MRAPGPAASRLGSFGKCSAAALPVGRAFRGCGAPGQPLVPSRLRAEPGKGRRRPRELEDLAIRGHLGHSEKFAQRAGAASEMRFCFDSLKGKLGVGWGGD